MGRPPLPLGAHGQIIVFAADDRLVEDTFVRTAKSGSEQEADFLAWAAIMWSEPRVARIVEDILTDADGHFDGTQFSAETVKEGFDESIKSRGKWASSLLNRMSQAHLIEPARHGSAIVGIDQVLPTGRFAPVLVEFIAERVLAQVSDVVARRGDAVELALLWKANRWLGLSQNEFRRPARPMPPVQPALRSAVPERLELLDQELRRRGQVVLQGAPGVGKTHVALDYVDWATSNRAVASNLTAIIGGLPDNERTPEALASVIHSRGLTAVWDLTQFHPSYGYEDFVRALAPHPAPGGVTFRAEHRALSLLAAVGEALERAGSACDVILVVDEINRADIARTFGELLYALEYRGRPIRTPYAVGGDASMTLPGNLLMIGTMNTADRSIALIDYALRRRFTFIGLVPDRDVVRDASWIGETDRKGALALFDLTQTLFTGDGLSLAVGHSYFLPSSTAGDLATSLTQLARRFAYEVVPLLQEYAAEGLIELQALSTVLASAGVETAVEQCETERQVLEWLKNQ